MGLDTVIVLDRAVVDLADRRFMAVLDAPVQMHLLASIVAQAQSWLGEQVAAARDVGASWAEIGALLGVSAATARQHYTPPPANARRQSRSRSTPTPTTSLTD